jgi:integrase
MVAKLTKTTTPGIYRRHLKGCDRTGRCECGYVVIYDGKKQTFPTLAEAREGRILARRQAKLSRAHSEGLHPVDDPRADCPNCERRKVERDEQAPLLHTYARAWLDRYHGTGKRGFREETRGEYRGLMDKYALSYFPADTKLRAVGPSEIAALIAWQVKQPGRDGTLTDKSVRNALGPLRACLASAKREGLIRDNPAVGAALPHRPRIEEDEELPRPFPRIEGEETMELVVALVHADHRLMFELLAATGLRRSGLLALEVRHLALDGANPHVRVRQRSRPQKGNGQVIGPLKSLHARRDLPIPLSLADRLRAGVTGRKQDALVFASPETGRPYDPAHLHLRVLKPACAEAGVEWAGFHTFRHTVASRIFAAGRTAVQVQHWLGHHSAAFTLRTYVHLLDPSDLGGPLEPIDPQEGFVGPRRAHADSSASLVPIARF